MFRNRFFTIAIFVAVCLLTSVLTVFGSFIVDAVSSYGKDKTEVAPASYPHLAQNLQNDLNSALSPQFSFNFDTADNPFADKTGVSLAVNEKQNMPVGNNGQIQPTVLPKGAFPTSTQVVPVQTFGNNQVMPNNTNVPQPVVPTLPVSDSKTLLAERNRQIRQGLEVGDLSAIYSIEDVRPIGMIGSGDKNRVWLYSPSTKQTFSVRKGTHFRDGTIETVNKEGVEFRRNDGTTANTRWMKNSEKSKDDADAPILRVEPTTQAAQYQPQTLPNNFPTQPTVRVRSKSKRN